MEWELRESKARFGENFGIFGGWLCYNLGMKTFVVSNWKMNFTVGESSVYLNKILKKMPAMKGLEVVVMPSMVALQSLSLQVDRKKIKLGIQNFYHKDYGPYTGEISLTQARGLVDYALVGHSERRFLFNESEREIRQKMAAALRHKITPILCVGETANERMYGEMKDAIRGQLVGGLADVAEDEIEKVMIAYEPVWTLSSVGDLKFASPDQVAEAVAMIRGELKEIYGKKRAEMVPILFGGSVNPNNAGAYLTVPGVNGVMMSRSGLILEQFLDIIEVAKRVIK